MVKEVTKFYNLGNKSFETVAVFYCLLCTTSLTKVITRTKQLIRKTILFAIVLGSTFHKLIFDMSKSKSSLF